MMDVLIVRRQVDNRLVTGRIRIIKIGKHDGAVKCRRFRPEHMEREPRIAGSLLGASFKDAGPWLGGRTDVSRASRCRVGSAQRPRYWSGSTVKLTGCGAAPTETQE